MAINYEIHPSTTPMADTSCSSGFGWPSIRDDRRDDESLEAGGSYRCLAPVSCYSTVAMEKFVYWKSSEKKEQLRRCLIRRVFP